MSVKKKLESLDKMVVKGNIIDAFDRFFDKNVVTHSDAGDRSKDKAQKREWLIKFFSLVQKIDKIELHGQTVTGNVTHSKFTFEFSTTWGAPLVWHEIIRRTWRDGLVIDEYYYEGELPKAKAVKKKAAPKKKVTKKVTPKKKATPKKKPATKKVVKKETPKKITRKPTGKKVIKKVIRKPAVRRVVKPDDLKKIEGIGPKIAELLTNAGIKTFAKLAVTKPARISTILAAAGNRYKMHNPATWPQQAKLAKAQKWTELKKLQDVLKGGRK